MAKYSKVAKPREGDLATHVNGKLDPRKVVRVIENEVDGAMIWLELSTSGSVFGPFPARNYTFEREVEA